MRSARYRLALIFVAVATTVSAARAQQPGDQQGQNNQQGTSGQSQPIPAYRSPLASQADNGESAAPQELSPDTRPLAGAENLTLGVPSENRSYFQPHINVTETGDSDALGANAGWTSYTSVSGGADLHVNSGYSNLLLTYSGGGSFSNDGKIGNSVVQGLGFSEKLSMRRITLSFLDNFDYIPESGFGYGAGGGVNLPAGVGLQSGLTPNQTILTTRSQRVDNSFVTQLDLALTSRSSMTFLGGYSLLHYLDNSASDFSGINFQGGYNRQLNRKDTIAILYRFNEYRFNGPSPTINDNTVLVTYGRRVTGRLAFQIAGGPEITFYPSATSGGGGGSTSSSAHAYWSMNTALTYQLVRTVLGFSYNHSITAGSGVLAGAVTDQFSGNVTRQLSRRVSGGINTGYARNKTLSILLATPVNQTYNYWFAGANLNKTLGRTLALNLSYQLQYQNSSSATCIGPTCDASLTRNVVSLGLTWQGRPIPLH